MKRRRRWKDWKSGQYRVKMQVVDDEGGVIEAYIPNCDPGHAKNVMAATLQAAILKGEGVPQIDICGGCHLDDEGEESGEEVPLH